LKVLQLRAVDAGVALGRPGSEARPALLDQVVKDGAGVLDTLRERVQHVRDTCLARVSRHLGAVVIRPAAGVDRG